MNVSLIGVVSRLCASWGSKGGGCIFTILETRQQHKRTAIAGVVILVLRKRSSDYSTTRYIAGRTNFIGPSPLGKSSPARS